MLDFSDVLPLIFVSLAILLTIFCFVVGTFWPCQFNHFFSREDGYYCSDCGEQIKDLPTFCSECGEEYRSNYHFCPGCGFDLKPGC